MKIAIIAINEDGDVIARKIKKVFNKADIYSNTGGKRQDRCPVTRITEKVFNILNIPCVLCVNFASLRLKN